MPISCNCLLTSAITTRAMNPVSSSIGSPSLHLVLTTALLAAVNIGSRICRSSSVIAGLLSRAFLLDGDTGPTSTFSIFRIYIWRGASLPVKSDAYPPVKREAIFHRPVNITGDNYLTHNFSSVGSTTPGPPAVASYPGNQGRGGMVQGCSRGDILCECARPPLAMESPCQSPRLAHQTLHRRICMIRRSEMLCAFHW